MNRLRRSMALAASLAVLTEAVVLGTAHWILGLVVRAQEMTLAGISAQTISLTTWSGGALLGGLLLLCAGSLARAGVRDRFDGRIGRALVICCLVVQAVLAVVAVGLVGWWAFAALMTLFGALLLTLCAYPPAAAREGRGRGRRAGSVPDRGAGDDAATPPRTDALPA